MKKSVALLLSMMLLLTMLMTGCSRLIHVEFTVEGIDDRAVQYVGSQKITSAMQRQELSPDAPAVYTFNVPGDGDYDMMAYDKDSTTYPFTLKVHNGKVEVEASEGITVNATIK